MAGCAGSPPQAPPTVFIGTPPAANPAASPAPATISLSQPTWVGDAAQQWQCTLRIGLGFAPESAQLRLRVVFVERSSRERALIDGNQIQERSIPLTNAQPLVETVSVSFLSGQQLMREAAVLVVMPRAHGFEAGEYQMTVQNDRGQVLGAPTTVVLVGANPVVDRRPCAFSPAGCDGH